ncbi:MAG TPA: hypothetical protein VM925_31385 [Labilithrix sp.]|nr:hypothetical protein [Labilithrix sp.]
MTCETSSDELVTWLREEIAWLRDEVRELRGELLEAQEAAALARGGEKFWRAVAERIGVSAIDAAAVSKRILEERRVTG